MCIVWLGVYVTVLCCVCMYILCAICMYMCVVLWSGYVGMCYVLCCVGERLCGGMRERLHICGLGVHMCMEKTKENVCYIYQRIRKVNLLHKPCLLIPLLIGKSIDHIAYFFGYNDHPTSLSWVLCHLHFIWYYKMIWKGDNKKNTGRISKLFFSESFQQLNKNWRMCGIRGVLDYQEINSRKKKTC